MVTKFESKLKIKEMDRFENNKGVAVYGSRGGQDGDYYFYSKISKTFSVGKDFYYSNNGVVEALVSDKTAELRDVILPALSKDYGFVLGGEGSKVAYILADTTCPFSQKFFKSGGASKLMDSGYRVVVIPMSRKVVQNELVGLSVFNCNLTLAEKKADFIGAINKGVALTLPMKKQTAQCSYWGGLKANYSIFEDFDLNGFPSIIKSDSDKIEYGSTVD